MTVIDFLELAVSLFLGLVTISSLTSNPLETGGASKTTSSKMTTTIPTMYVKKHLSNHWACLNGDDNDPKLKKHEMKTRKQKKPSKYQRSTYKKSSLGHILGTTVPVPIQSSQRQSNINNMMPSQQIQTSKSGDGSNMSILKQMAKETSSTNSQQIQGKDIDKKTKEVDLSRGIKSLIYFLETRMNALKSLKEGKIEGNMELTILLLTLLSNIPVYAYLLNNLKSIVSTLVKSIELLGVIDVKTSNLTNPFEATKLLHQLLLKNNNNNNKTLMSFLIENKSEFTTTNISLKDFESRTDYRKLFHQFQQAVESSSSRSSSSSSRGGGDVENQMGGTDLDVLQEQEEAQLKENRQRSSASITLQCWFRRRLALKKTSMESDQSEQSKVKILKILQDELDNHNRTDKYECRLCKVKLKGTNIEDHVSLIERMLPKPLLAPMGPTYFDAGRLLYQQRPVSFLGYGESGHSKLCFGDKSAANPFFYGEPEVPVDSDNTTYYNQYVRYCKAKLDEADQKHQTIISQLEAAIQHANDEEIRHLQDALAQIEGECEQFSHLTHTVVNYSGYCIFSQHRNDSHHNELFEELHSFRNIHEKRSLQSLVDAILLSRRIPRTLKLISDKKLNGEYVSDETLSVVEDIKLTVVDLETSINSIKELLKHTRTKSRFSNKDALKNMENKNTQLLKTITTLEESMKNALLINYEATVSEDNVNDEIDEDEEEDEDGQDDGDRTEAQHDGGDDFIVVAPKKKKGNQTKKKKGPSGGLANSNHKRSWRGSKSKGSKK
mmetsp:Transcript_11723/g.15100  ORF Transcript_11723/g.15100 Transcript_11723/m.15100 type:complete len:779 (+) Transcript_11723:1-2337(+)